MKTFISTGDFTERIFWLIRLRWMAVVGVVLTVFVVDTLLEIPLFPLPLYTIAFLLGGYNLLFLIYLKHIIKRKIPHLVKTANRIANSQISLDFLSLTALIHFSGGIENPFIFYFIFHMIIASILLSRWASFLQASFAVFLFCSLVTLEYLGILPHYCLKGFIDSSLHGNALHIAGTSFVFISTVYIAVYMTTSITVRLRDREMNLREANRLLTEKDRAKSEYVLRVAHDIKEHLAAVQSCIEPVTSGITGQLNKKQMDLLQRADDRTAKLSFFVKALLEISRIKLSKDIKMEYFSIRETVRNALSYVEAKAKSKGITLASHVDAGIDRIKGIETYIEETIANLLANAIKYTPQGGSVAIDVSDRDASILIEIRDTGIGIPEDEIGKIFDEFYRARNAKEVEKDGTGLGLSIAKQVVERHNGRIWVESKEGKGSSFYITLPKEKYAAQAEDV